MYQHWHIGPAPTNNILINMDKKPVREDVHMIGHKSASNWPASVFAHPGILAAEFKKSAFQS
jgi:hypothetical protein